MILNRDEYRSKVLGCWMGKNIGGTLGAPFEWQRQINNVTFYTQKLDGEPALNDDLDIQLLWLVALEERGVKLDAQTLAEYWVLYVTPHWSEYGVGKVNMRSGLMPPLCGSQHNEYKDSCGSFIRSEIWACITPGNPRLAARYAYADSILNHADEGLYAEVFCATLESAAFVEQDIAKLIKIGLSYIPADCGVAKAIACAIESHRSGKSWQQARDIILEKYRGLAFFGMSHCISPADVKKGFFEGPRGWDAPSNIAMIIIGLLYGEGDFDKSMCTAVNCGEDTDCTGATLGSIFGIMHGIAAIPEKWIKPIGKRIRTACLNLGELGYFGNQIPANVDNLTDRTEQIAHQVMVQFRSKSKIADQPTDLSDLNKDRLPADAEELAHLYHTTGPIYRFDFFNVAVDYGTEPTIRDHEPKIIRLEIDNHYKVPANIKIHWYAPDGWRVRPSRDAMVMCVQSCLGKQPVVEFAIEADQVSGPINRLVAELTIDGRPTVMLVPVILVNGNVVAK